MTDKLYYIFIMNSYTRYTLKTKKRKIKKNLKATQSTQSHHINLSSLFDQDRSH